MKRSLLALAAIAALPIAATAQTQSATVNVKATVASSVTITEINNTIDFGTTGLTPGAAASVPASGSTSYQSSVVANEQVNIAIPSTTVAMSDGGTGSFSVTLSCGTAATSNAATTTAMASCAGSVPAGTTYFYVGASIASGATTSAPAGSYTGSTTLNYTWTKY